MAFDSQFFLTSNGSAGFEGFRLNQIWISIGWEDSQIVRELRREEGQYNANRFLFVTQQPVWRIGDVYPGSRIRLFTIPDPGSELSPSRIPDPHQRI